MYKNILFLVILFLITGCNQSATSVFKKDPDYAQNLQYTKIVKIIDKKENIPLLANITYLNSVDTDKYTKNQYFLIGAYSDKENITYNITMNGKIPINIDNIDANSIKYKNIAFKNNWANYYIYEFINTPDKKLTLKLSLKNINSNTISFDKE